MNGTLPLTANWAMVTIDSDARPDDLIAVAVSFDESGHYGAQTPFSDQLSAHWVGGKWEAGGNKNSLIAIGNGGTKPSRAAVTFYYNDGKGKYELEQMLDAGEQLWLDMDRIIRQRIPDKNGSTLPEDITSGTYDLWDKTDTGNGSLFEGKVITDKGLGHAAYGCMICCGPTLITIQQDPTSLAIGSLAGMTVTAIDDCSGESEDITGQFNTWWTGNTSIATAGTATFSGVSLGTTLGYARGVVLQGGGIDSQECPTYVKTVHSTVNTVATPTNFHLVSSADAGNGDLRLVYSWDSTSGNLSDLGNCTVGEIVSYPGSSNPYPFPSPPFPNDSYSNPTVIDLPATAGGFQDDHMLTPSTTFVTPYSSSIFTATQFYRFRCSNYQFNQYVNLQGPLSIVRAVSQNSNGSWKFTVTKGGSSATINPLP